MKSLGNSSAPRQTSSSHDQPPPRKRFALTGRSRPFDPIRTAARRDIADVRLAEQVFAPHYAAPLPREIAVGAALTADRDGDPIGQVQAGEIFEVLEITTDHAWGVAQPSGLVGYLPLTALA